VAKYIGLIKKYLSWSLVHIEKHICVVASIFVFNDSEEIVLKNICV